MNYARNLSITLIVFQLVISVVYFKQKDYRRGVYWFAAAVLTGSVTF